MRHGTRTSSPAAALTVEGPSGVLKGMAVRLTGETASHQGYGRDAAQGRAVVPVSPHVCGSLVPWPSALAITPGT